MRYEKDPSDSQRLIIEERELSMPLKVVAGAGTGKTFVLAHRFVWLVMERGLAPERMLALTFTKNAAAEMRGRIRRLLRLNGCPEPPALWVYTFHGFADRVLRENAYAAGLDPDLQVLSEIHEELYLNEILDAAFEGEFSKLNSLKPERLAGLGVEKPGDLRKILREMLGQAKGRGLGPDDFRREALKNCQKFWGALPTAAEVRDVAPNDLPELIRLALSEAGGRPLQAPPGGKWASSDTIEVRKLYFTASRKGGSPDQPRPDTQVLLASAQAAEAGLIESAAQLYELYQQRLRAEGAIDYDGQIIQALELLRQPGFAERYREQFDYLLVDEFQDTSLSQLELVQRLAHEQQGSYSRLLVVGDRKQSIYGWRQARPDNLDELLPFQAGHSGFRPLTESYRLTERIAELANRAGAEANVQDPPLVAKADGEGRLLYPAPFDAEQGGLRYSRREEAKYLAQRIQLLREAGEIEDLADVAVLIRRRSAFRPLKVAFELHGLRYQAQGGVGFFDHPLARDLIAWLRLLQDPAQDMYAARLLTSPPCSLTDRELFLLLTAPDEKRGWGRPDLTVMELIEQRLQGAGETPLPPELRERLESFRQRWQALQELARQAPAPQTLEAVWRHCAEHAALTPSEGAAVPVVRATFGGLIDEMGGDRPPHLHDLVRTLDLYLGDDRRELPVADQPAQGAVQVMTLHRAKGLEWPVVFLLSWTPTETSRPTYDERWGAQGLRVGGMDPKATILKMLEKANQRDDEELRLAYVGLTRAQRILAVTRAAGGKGKLPEYPRAAYFEDAEEEAPLPPVAVAPEAALVRPAPPEVLERALPSRPERLRVSFTQLQRLENCPRGWVLSRQARGWPEGAEAHAETETDTSLVGSRFHELAAAVVERDLHGTAAQALTETLAEDLEPRQQERFLALARAFLDSAWARPGEPAEVERPLCLLRREDGCLVEIVGVADLLLPNSQRLVDYKTEAVLSEENRAAHALQMYIYREALRAEGGPPPTEIVVAHVRPDGIDSVRLGQAEVEGQADRLEGLLRELVAVAGGAPAESRAGRHCQYCDFAACCPEAPAEASAAED